MNLEGKVTAYLNTQVPHVRLNLYGNIIRNVGVVWCKPRLCSKSQEFKLVCIRMHIHLLLYLGMTKGACT